MAQKDATTLAYWLKRTKGTKNAKNKAYTLQKRAIKAAGRTGRVDVSKVVRSDYGRKAYLGESPMPKARNVGMPESRSVTSGAPPMRKSGGSSSGSSVAGQVAAAATMGAATGGTAFAVARKVRAKKAALAQQAARTNKQQATRERNQRARARAQRATDRANARQAQARAGARTAGTASTPKGVEAPRPVRIVNYTALGDAPSPEARRGSGGRLGRAARASSGRR